MDRCYEIGIQDNKEVGLQGIIVTLFTENGQKVETTTTNSNGYYLFSNLSRGNYYLSFRNIPSECNSLLKMLYQMILKTPDCRFNNWRDILAVFPCGVGSPFSSPCLSVLVLEHLSWQRVLPRLWSWSRF